MGIRYTFYLDQKFADQYPAKFALVLSTLPGYSAQDAGLKEGDMIIAVNGNRLSNKDTIAEAVGNLNKSDSINFSVVRPSLYELNEQGFSPYDPYSNLEFQISTKPCPEE